MKYFKTLIAIFIVILISCSSENNDYDQNSKKKSDGQSDNEIPFVKKSVKSSYIIPNNHELFGLEGIDDLMDFYPKIDTKYESRDYVNNLKDVSIDALFVNGLLKQNNDVIIYFIEELSSLNHSLLNVKNFNEAIHELEKKDINKKRFKSHVIEFCNKNIEFLEKLLEKNQKEINKDKLSILEKLKKEYQ